MAEMTRQTGQEVARFGADDARMNQTTELGESAIRARALVREFDGVAAVDGIDLDIRKGEIYGLLGPNGAGKSTTVRVLCTLISPTAGTATVAGYDVGTQPE